MYSFNSIIESEANVNGVWDDNSLFIQISLVLVAKQTETTTYSCKSIVESMSNVNGVWDDNSLFIQISLALVGH